MLYYSRSSCVIPEPASQSASSFHPRVYEVELLAQRLFFFVQYFINQAYITLSINASTVLYHYPNSLSLSPSMFIAANI